MQPATIVFLAIASTPAAAVDGIFQSLEQLVSMMGNHARTCPRATALEYMAARSDLAYTVESRRVQSG